MSQRFITRETPINLVLVSVDGSTRHISQGISQEQGIECSDINLSEIAKNLSLPTNLIEQMPELLHMQLLASGNMVNNLAPAPLTKKYEFDQLKRAIEIGTFVLAMLGLIIATFIFYQGLSHQSALKDATEDTTLQQRRYDEAAKNFPVTTIGAEDLKIAVELDKTIASYPKSPRRMMRVISAALEQAPEVQLDRLRWVLSNDINIEDEDKLVKLSAGALSTNVNGTFNLDTVKPDPLKFNELGFMTAEISGFAGDYRSALNSVNQFVEKLKADKNVAAVEVLQEPVNVSSFVNLQGSTTDEQATQIQPAMFKLKVILKATDTMQEVAEIK
jgi:hypothetical protein